MKNKGIKKTKEVSNQELAAMIAKGFASVDKRFEEVNERFEQIDQRFDHLENRVDRIEKTVISIDQKVENIDKRLKRVEEIIEPLLVGYQIMQREIRELNGRVHRLEKKVGLVK